MFDTKLTKYCYFYRFTALNLSKYGGYRSDFDAQKMMIIFIWI